MYVFVYVRGHIVVDNVFDIRNVQTSSSHLKMYTIKYHNTSNYGAVFDSLKFQENMQSLRYS